MVDRERAIEELKSAIREQSRCMGGVDPAGCVAASKRITSLRNALRDNRLLIEYVRAVALNKS